MDAASQFHFLRPEWLLLALVLGGLWHMARRREARANRPPLGLIAAHLADHLYLNRQWPAKVKAVDLVALVAGLCALAAAGPAWRKAPSPFFADRAPAVVALEVSPTMLVADVAPNRLAWAQVKIRDLLEARAGAKTALVAYASSAHRVMPLTDDPAVLLPFLESLHPEVMPEPGDDAAAALGLAAELLSSKDSGPTDAGTVVLVTDGSAANLTEAVGSLTERGIAVAALVIGTESGGVGRTADGALLSGNDGKPLRAEVTPEVLSQMSGAGVSVVRSTIDDADIVRLLRAIQTHYQRSDGDEHGRWQDDGYFFVLLALIGLLLAFRRGFVMTAGLAALVTGSSLVGALVAMPPTPVQAQSAAGPAVPEQHTQPATASPPHQPRSMVRQWFVNLWLTPDQQGRWLLESNRPTAAMAHFSDPAWRGIAAYRAGDFAAAADAFGTVGTADGEYNLGNALIKQRNYVDALAAFTRAVELEPEHRLAKENRDQVRRIIEYLDEAREQSDTDGKLGADDLKFDLTEGRGKKIRVEATSEMTVESAEQWMRTVETDGGEFLRQRFVADLQRRESN